MRRFWLVIGMLLLAGLAIGAVACGGGKKKTTTTPTSQPTAAATTAATQPSGTTTGAASTVHVNLVDYKVLPDKASVPAGSVTFNAQNIGGENHEMVVLRTDLPEDTLPTKADGSVDETAAGMEVIAEIEEFAPEGEESLTVDLEPGSYVLLCNTVAEMNGAPHVHYAEGMHAAFEVTQ